MTIKMEEIKNRKHTVIDTNILMTLLDKLKMPDRTTDIYVPKAVMDELNYLKDKEDLTTQVDMAKEYLQRRSPNRDPRLGRYVFETSEVSQKRGCKVSNDDKILCWALQLQKELGVTVNCFSKDVILQIKAIACGMDAFSDNQTPVMMPPDEDVKVSNEDVKVKQRAAKTAHYMLQHIRSPKNQTLLGAAPSAAASPAAVGCKSSDTVDLIVDKNWLIHRLPLLETLLELNNFEWTVKFRVHIPWRVMIALDLLKVSDESEEVKIKAAKMAKYLLQHIRSPWIGVQHMEADLQQWLEPLKERNCFVLSEDLRVKYIYDIRVINEEKLHLMYFSDTYIQTASRQLPPIPLSTQPWFRQLVTAINNKKKKTNGKVLKPNRIKTKKIKKKLRNILFRPTWTQNSATDDRFDGLMGGLMDDHELMISRWASPRNKKYVLADAQGSATCTSS